MFPAIKKIAENIKDIIAVSLKMFCVALFTKSLCPLAVASDISGISKVEIEPKRAEGKKISGNAIPFIIPKRESECVELKEYFERFFGTKIFSAVRSSVFKYLPEVIGTAICSILETVLRGGFVFFAWQLFFFLSNK